MDIPDEFENPAEYAAFLMRKTRVTPADCETAARALLRGGGRHEGYERRLKARLIWGRRLSEGEAENLIADIFMKFMKNPPREGTPAEAWLFVLREQRANEDYRERMAAKRQAEVLSLDEEREDGQKLVEEPKDSFNLEASLALRQCLEAGFAKLRKSVSATLFKVLQMVALEMEISEIASALDMTYTNAKDHVHRARKAARPFFEECKE